MRQKDFVGRIKDLDQLTGFMAEAAKGNPVTVVLDGESGVGKTRMIREFIAKNEQKADEQKADEQKADERQAHVLTGGCIALGGGSVPYAPLIEALQRLVHKFGEDKVREIAGEAWPDLAVLISDLTGSRPADVPRSQLQVFGAVLRLLKHLGRSAPVVLVFEDLHWADPSTLDLVSYLSRMKTTEKMMLICSHRSDLPVNHPLRLLLAEPEFARHIRRMKLSRFTEPELKEFLKNSKVVKRDLIRRCFSLSEGNVFFAEQLINSDALADLTVTKVPDLLAEVMRSRIGSLGEDAARLMSVAAIASRKVSESLLMTVSGLADQRLDDALRECVKKGILTADPADDEDAYVFRHALLRETVYRDLLKGERRRLHERMAVAITANRKLSFADDLTAEGELAYHWSQAGRKPEAFVASVRAGAATARVQAFQEAESHYTQALHLWPEVVHPEDLAEMSKEQVLAAAAEAAGWAGHSGIAVKFIQEAIAVVDPDRDPHRSGELHERLGAYQWAVGLPAESMAAYAIASTLLVGRTPDALSARVMAALAMEEVRGGRFPEGLHQATAALVVAKGVDAIAEQCHALCVVGLALTFLGQSSEGENQLREALVIAKEIGNIEEIFRAHANLGVALEHVGKVTESVALAMDGLRLAQRLGLASSRQASVMANNAAATLYLLGRWQEAIELIDEAILDRANVRESAYLRLTLAEIDVACGRFDKASKLLGDAREQPVADPRFLGPLHVCDAELAIWRGDRAAARAAVEMGIAVLGGSGNTLVRLRLRAAGLRVVADARETGTEDVGSADVETRELTPDASVADASAVNASAVNASIVNAFVADESGEADDDGTPTEMGTLSLLCKAERARADGISTATMWSDIAAAWDRLDRPYPAAYARWREAADARAANDLPRAAEVADEARAVAERLGAVPLRTAIETLYPKAAEPVVTRTPKNSYKVTDRELEILALLNRGLSNSEIASRLVITPKTASVHVTNILKKLNVTSRGAAAAKAREEGLLNNENPGAAAVVRQRVGDDAVKYQEL